MHERPDPSSPGASPGRSVPAASRILLVVVGVAAFWVLGKTLGRYVPMAAEAVAGFGPAGPLVFIAAYAAAVVAFVPGSILTLAAGAIFGLARGTAYVFVAATLGACCAFLVSRYLARERIEKRLERDARFAAIDRAIEKDGRKIVFLLRLSPVFPFSVLNYALGLTSVRFADYAVACIGMLPGTLLYVYYGKLAGDVAGAIGGGAPQRDAAYYVVLGIGLAATLAVAVVVARIARKALEESSDV